MILDGRRNLNRVVVARNAGLKKAMAVNYQWTEILAGPFANNTQTYTTSIISLRFDILSKWMGFGIKYKLIQRNRRVIRK